MFEIANRVLYDGATTKIFKLSAAAIGKAATSCLSVRKLTV